MKIDISLQIIPVPVNHREEAVKNNKPEEKKQKENY